MAARTSKVAAKKKAAKKAAAPKKAVAKKTAAPKKAVAKKTAAPKKAAVKQTSAPRGKDPVSMLRAICLVLPGAHEVESWGEPTFRVKNKIFAMHASPSTHHGAGRPAVWILSVSSEQDFVLRARPDRYFKPPYVGPSGWIGAWLDRNPPWNEITELVKDAYRRRAPKKLAAELGE